MAMIVGNVAQEVGSPNNGAKSLVLIIDDPDAPDPRALRMVWVHWVVYNLPPDTKSSPENTGKTGFCDRLETRTSGGASSFVGLAMCKELHLLGDAISLHAKRSPFRYSSFSRCGIGPRSIAAFMRAHASSKPSIYPSAYPTAELWRSNCLAGFGIVRSPAQDNSISLPDSIGRKTVLCVFPAYVADEPQPTRGRDRVVRHDPARAKIRTLQEINWL